MVFMRAKLTGRVCFAFLRLAYELVDVLIGDTKGSRNSASRAPPLAGLQLKESLDDLGFPGLVARAARLAVLCWLAPVSL